MLAAGWLKVATTRARRCCTRTTTRRSASCAATSTSTAGCARRSGTSSGSACARRSRDVRGARGRRPALDGRARLAGARARPLDGARRPCTTAAARSSPRSARARTALPAPVQRAISLEGRRAAAASAHAEAPRLPDLQHSDGRRSHRTRRSRASGATGPAPLLDPVPGHGASERAAHRGRDPAVPARQRRARRSSTCSRGSSACGHTFSTWLHDPLGQRRDEWPAVVRGEPARVLRAARGPGVQGLRRTGSAPTSCWRRAGRPVSRSCGSTTARARAYLVQDHEPEFFATSAESLWAQQTYRLGPVLHRRAARGCATSSSSATARGRRTSTSASTTTSTTRGRSSAATTRSSSTRATSTPRRAVPLGVLALEELHRRRPDLRFVLFGDNEPVRHAVPVRAPRRSPRRSSSRGRTRRRPSASRCR